MNKYIALALTSALMISNQASAEVIFRYKSNTVLTTTDGSGGGGVVTPPDGGGGDGGGTTPDTPIVTPIDCAVDDQSSEFDCNVTTDRPSETPGIEPLRLAQVSTPASADTNTYKFRCLQASGGYGNYIYEIGGLMPAAVQSLDFVPASNPNMAPKGDKTGFWWPGYEGDYDIVTSEANVCLRLSLDSDLDFQSIVTRVYIGDYADDVVVDGKANWNENLVDSEYAITLTINGTGTDNGNDGGGECTGSSCDLGTDIETVVCPTDPTADEFACVTAEVSKPEADPDTTPRLEFEWLPTPNDAYTQYHGYKCFAISGGNGNYAVLARDNSYEPWVGTVNVLPYGSANADGEFFNSMANYPGAKWTPETLGRQYVTNQQQFCVRVTPDANYEGDRNPANMEVMIKDYSGDVVSNASVPEEQRPDSFLKFIATLPGGSFVGVPSWQAMSFSATSMAMEYKTNGPVTQPIVFEPAQTGLTRGRPFYYQCFEFSGGPDSSWTYGLADAWPAVVPSWVEWYDLRPYSLLDSAYAPGTPDPLDDTEDQAWPMVGSGNSKTSEKNICIRVKAKDGATNKDPFKFRFDQFFGNVDGQSGVNQYIIIRWEATPL